MKKKKARHKSKLGRKKRERELAWMEHFRELCAYGFFNEAGGHLV